MTAGPLLAGPDELAAARLLKRSAELFHNRLPGGPTSMNHQDALREMSVERYLLGELTGESRDIFEEHLFDCQQCTADLKSGVTLLEGARTELATPSPARASAWQSA